VNDTQTANDTKTASASRSRLVLKLLPGGILLAAFYAFWIWAIYFPPGWVLTITGAADETGKTYGFHSGFGGSLLFSAAIIFPIWYYARTCKHSWDCLLPGTYTLAGSGARVCKWHHPNPPREGEGHHEWLHRLHTEQTVSMRQ
jgi:hypothetical protein